TEAVLEAASLQALRHQYRLEEEGFYTQPTPDGSGVMARVPAYLVRQVRDDLTARYPDQVQQAAHTLFRGRIGLHQLLGHATDGPGANVSLNWRTREGVYAGFKEWDFYERTILASGDSGTIRLS